VTTPTSSGGAARRGAGPDRPGDRVLRLLARGLSNRDTARTLFVAESTVKFHVANILRKRRRRSEAVYVASQMGAI